MEINFIAITGFLAGTFTTLSLLPQVIKAIKTKETKDLSISMFIILAAGLLLWIIYGILISAYPIILANLFSFILAAIIILLKIKYG